MAGSITIRRRRGSKSPDRLLSTTRARPSVWWLAPAALSFCAWAGALEPGWRKLSVGGPTSDVEFVQVSPDGKWAVYWHNPDSQSIYELFSVPVDGSALPRRISGVLPSTSGVRLFRISPDSARVIYLAEEDVGGRLELFRVPIAGGASTRLSADLVAGGDVEWFDLSPSGGRVVYAARQRFSDKRELFSVPTLGGVVTRLSGALVGGGNVEYDFQITPSGSRVVYRADQQTNDLFELYSVPIGGGAATKLSSTPAGFTGVDRFACGPLGNRVFYLATVFGIGRLFGVPAAGGDALVLNPSGSDVVDFEVSPTGDRVVYRAELEAFGEFNLYSVPSQGGDWVRLSGPLTSGGEIEEFTIGPKGERVIYLADQRTLGTVELFGAPIAGGGWVRLSGGLTSGGDVVEARFTADGDWVIYNADQVFDGWQVLYRVPPWGPNGSETLVSSLVHGARHQWRRWTLDPLRPRVVVLSNAPFLDSVERPWEAPLLEPLNPSARELVDDSEFPAGGSAYEVAITADGTVVYQADQNVEGKGELYAVVGRLIFQDGFESGSASAWSSSSTR